MLIEKTAWPQNKTCAAMISVNLDAEFFGKIYYPDTYSSSLSDDDVPYVREISGLLELPIHWELFDLPYFVFTFDPPIPPGQSRSARMDDVLKNWLYELKGARRFGTLFNLQLDPQAIGEQGRIFMLEALLEELKKADDVWVATGGEIAAHFGR